MNFPSWTLASAVRAPQVRYNLQSACKIRISKNTSRLPEWGRNSKSRMARRASQKPPQFCKRASSAPGKSCHVINRTTERTYTTLSACRPAFLSSLAVSPHRLKANQDRASFCLRPPIMRPLAASDHSSSRRHFSRVCLFFILPA